MIEVKFRGKRRDNGQWCYGLPKYNSAGLIGYMCGWFGEKGFEQYDEVEVVPETVGQYIGFGDIYNGDIVSINVVEEDAVGNESDACEMGEVKWGHAGFVVTIHDDDGSEWATEIDHDAIVIGNIFDNPELLKP